ncbi:hypothetical protein [Caldiplasma sukawensis]
MPRDRMKELFLELENVRWERHRILSFLISNINDGFPAKMKISRIIQNEDSLLLECYLEGQTMNFVIDENSYTTDKDGNKFNLITLNHSGNEGWDDKIKVGKDGVIEFSGRINKPRFIGYPFPIYAHMPLYENYLCVNLLCRPGSRITESYAIEMVKNEMIGDPDAKIEGEIYEREFLYNLKDALGEVEFSKLGDERPFGRSKFLEIFYSMYERKHKTTLFDF